MNERRVDERLETLFFIGSVLVRVSSFFFFSLFSLVGACHACVFFGKNNIMEKEDKLPSETRFVLMGGFLGAGKTTVIAALLRWLRERGRRCALITNDQGKGLVDSMIARQQTAAMAEITGGCFCCRLDELRAAVEQLSSGERPDVFLAEPVGSCTDLMATVLLPLGRIAGLALSFAPLSVVLDGRRAYRTLVGRGHSRDFSKDVGYIYRKQMEEAEILVINKCDLLTGAQLEKLRGELQRSYPGRRVLTVSAHKGDGLENWFELLMTEGSDPQSLMDVDYQRYGIGEALLGWLNATVQIPTRQSGMEGAEILHRLMHGIADGLERQDIPVAHCKIALQDDTGAILRVQMTRSGDKPVFAGELGGPLRSGRLLINLRAEGEPDRLSVTVSGALAAVLKGIKHDVTEFACFKPGQPIPTHRVEALV